MPRARSLLHRETPVQQLYEEQEWCMEGVCGGSVWRECVEGVWRECVEGVCGGSWFVRMWKSVNKCKVCMGSILTDTDDK